MAVGGQIFSLFRFFAIIYFTDPVYVRLMSTAGFQTVLQKKAFYKKMSEIKHFIFFTWTIRIFLPKKNEIFFWQKTFLQKSIQINLYPHLIKIIYMFMPLTYFLRLISTYLILHNLFFFTLSKFRLKNSVYNLPCIPSVCFRRFIHWWLLLYRHP